MCVVITKIELDRQTRIAKPIELSYLCYNSAFSVASNQPEPNMYHDMGYPSHSYANYLAQYESNAYGDSAHFTHHLAAVPLPPPPPPPPYTSDPMHHQHLAMMQPQQNRTWYQPPIAVTPQIDHRYCYVLSTKHIFTLPESEQRCQNKTTLHSTFILERTNTSIFFSILIKFS